MTNPLRAVFFLLALLFAPPALAQTPIDDAARANARAIFARIIAMDTSVEGRQTPAMAAYLAGELRAAGFPERDVSVIPFGETAALVARYRGDGSGGRPILLMAHMDVVPAHRSDWTRDPFTLIEEDGFFFGRGASDNKDGIAHLTALFIFWKRHGFAPTRDLILVFTGDEETSGATARMLIADHRDLIDADFALNSDAGGGAFDDETGAPLIYSVQTAEKSFASFTFTVRNPGGHSSRPRPDNAIYDLGDALARLRAHEFPVMWNDTTLAAFRAEAASGARGEIPDALRRFAARPGDRRAAQRLSREAAYIGQIRTTCVPTLLAAGHADNALPQSAAATINCRIFPGITIEQIQAQLQDIAGSNVEVRPLEQYWSSPPSPLRDDVFAAITAAARARYPSVPIAPDMSAGATDGVFFRAAGIPTYGASGVFMRDRDDFAHGLNERVPVTSFYEALDHWNILIHALASAPPAP